MTRRQPAAHLQQQAPCTEEQGGCHLDAGHQLQLGGKAVRQLDPVMGFRAQPVGLVQRGQ